MSRRCLNNPDSFCYVCGEFTVQKERRNITPLIRKAYALYFGFEIKNLDKAWLPHVCCLRCSRYLTGWLKGTHSSLPFGVPMLWREQADHISDCYFCTVKVFGFSTKSKHEIQYPNLTSSSRPRAHDHNIPVPKPPTELSVGNSSPSLALPQNEIHTESEITDSSQESDFHEEQSNTPHLINQCELNDLVRDLNLSKLQAELLGSRLQQWNLLQRETKISSFRNREKHLTGFFSMDDGLVYCNNVDGLMLAMGKEHKPSEWRLFIDSSKLSLKAVLLHNGNIYPSVPVAHAVHMEESYNNMELLLSKIKYDKYSWHICGDLKVVGLLLGLQKGYTKYCCFLCEWDSRARSTHYIVKNWPERQHLVPGEKNVKNNPLVDPQKILLPPLHIKLGLMKNFVKAMNKEGAGFKYLRNQFKRLSDAKIKEGIFVGPDIRKMLRDQNFEELLNEKEKPAWRSFKLVCGNFLGNKKAENYVELIDNLLSSYHQMGCNMSLKIHFLHSHLDFFPVNLGAVSDEHGERFHQDISNMERRYQGKWSPNMLADYCWTLARDDVDTVHKRKVLKLNRN